MPSPALVRPRSTSRREGRMIKVPRYGIETRLVHYCSSFFDTHHLGRYDVLGNNSGGGAAAAGVP